MTAPSNSPARSFTCRLLPTPIATESASSIRTSACCRTSSVAENISLGREVTRHLRIDADAARDAARRALSMLMVDDIPVDASVAELTQAQRQLVEIAKVLTLQGSRVLVFDEPTAALSADDAARLFTAIRSLAAEGIAVIFVSHRYQEVLELCDHVTVLRNGQVVHHGTADGMTVDLMVELTLGQRAESVFARTWQAPDDSDVVLAVDRSADCWSRRTVDVQRSAR